MKRVLAYFTMAFLTVGLAAPSFSNELSVFGGSPIPHGANVGGDYGQKSGGWEAGASYGVPLNGRFTFYVEGCYHQLPNAVRLDWLSPMKVAEGSANLKIFTCNRHALKPYLLMGVGLAEISFLVDYATTQQTSSSFEPVLRCGAGLDYTLGKKMTIFAEALAFESVNLSMIPVRAGIRFSL